MVKAVGNAAGQVADRSNRVGQIAAEVQKASNAIATRAMTMSVKDKAQGVFGGAVADGSAASGPARSAPRPVR